MTRPRHTLSEQPIKRYKELLAIAVECLLALGETEVPKWIEANLPPPEKK